MNALNGYGSQLMCRNPKLFRRALPVVVWLIQHINEIAAFIWILSRGFSPKLVLSIKKPAFPFIDFSSAKAYNIPSPLWATPLPKEDANDDNRKGGYFLTIL